METLMYKILHIPTGELLNGLFSDNEHLEQRWVGQIETHGSERSGLITFRLPNHARNTFSYIQTIILIHNIHKDSSCDRGIPIYTKDGLSFVISEREFEIIWDT
jgi:hypothetical protein